MHSDADRRTETELDGVPAEEEYEEIHPSRSTGLDDGDADSRRVEVSDSSEQGCGGHPRRSCSCSDSAQESVRRRVAMEQNVKAERDVQAET